MGVYVQQARHKHEGSANLLLPMKLQPVQLRDRYANEPKVSGHINSSVDIGRYMNIHAVAVRRRRIARIIPQPAVLDRRALENRLADKANAKQDVEHHRPQKKLANHGARKNLQVEHGQRQFDKRKKRQVQHLHDVEEQAKGDDFFRAEAPDVLADAVLPQPGQQGGQAGDGDGRRQQDQAVVNVEAPVPPAEEEPVCEAHDNDGGGDEPEDNVDDEKRRRGVADGRLTCYLCGVSGDYIACQQALEHRLQYQWFIQIASGSGHAPRRHPCSDSLLETAWQE